MQAFFHEFIQDGGKIYCYADFSTVLSQNFRGNSLSAMSNQFKVGTPLSLHGKKAACYKAQYNFTNLLRGSIKDNITIT